MAAQPPPSLLDQNSKLAQNYQLIETARVIRVFFETGTFDRAARSQQAITQFSAKAYKAAQGNFGDLIGQVGPVAQVDPIAGVSAPPPQYRLRVVTTISERTLEVPYLSVDPCVQFVPEENDYVLVLFLGAFQGVAFGHYTHVSSADGSYRQDRIPLQRGEVAIVPRNKLQPGTTHLVMTNGGVVRLASSDGCHMTMEPAGDQATLLTRNYRHLSGVHSLLIREQQSTFREGDLDLEVYDRSIVRSDLGEAILGATQDLVAERLMSVLRMGRTLFNRGSQIPGRALEDGLDPVRDSLFLGLEQEVPLQSVADATTPGAAAGNTDTAFRELRRLKTFFVFDNRGNAELNAGNYTPIEPEVPDVEDPPLETPLPPEDPPIDSVDAKVRASRNVKLDALQDVLVTALKAIRTASAGPTEGKALSFKFEAGPEATPGIFSISETGKVSMIFGPDPDLPIAAIEINPAPTPLDPTATPATPTISIRTLGVAVIDAPILQLGLTGLTTIRAGLLPTGANIIFDPSGDLSIEAPLGDVNINVVSAGALNLGGSGAKLMLDTIIGKFNSHTHPTAGLGPPSGPSTSFGPADTSGKAESAP